MTSIFPLTYIEIIIWLILVFAPENYVIKLVGSFFGYAVALTSVGGEQWINADSSNVLTLQTFNSGFEPTLGIIILGIDMIITYVTVKAIYENYKTGHGIFI